MLSPCLLGVHGWNNSKATDLSMGRNTYVEPCLNILDLFYLNLNTLNKVSLYITFLLVISELMGIEFLA